MVEHDLAKVGVEGSNPFARSSFFEMAKFDESPLHCSGLFVFGRCVAPHLLRFAAAIPQTRPQFLTPIPPPLSRTRHSCGESRPISVFLPERD